MLRVNCWLKLSHCVAISYLILYRFCSFNINVHCCIVPRHWNKCYWMNEWMNEICYANKRRHRRHRLKYRDTVNHISRYGTFKNTSIIWYIPDAFYILYPWCNKTSFNHNLIIIIETNSRKYQLFTNLFAVSDSKYQHSLQCS